VKADAPEAMSATVDVLVEGRADDESVMSTVGLVRDGDAIIVIDPGMVRDRNQILEPLAALGVNPSDVTDIVLSHHHPDHTLNAALFPNARVHDHWAIYFRDTWTDREADGVLITPSVRLIATPGHSQQDITTLVGTAQGLMAFTHAWWMSSGPAEDPYADMDQLHLSRARILAIAQRIVPGHGAPFAPTVDTPR
jgi:glyoxylase-like metal-dependent hydrolase (beta-lactamase superfamily II)